MTYAEHERQRRRLIDQVIGTPCPRCGVTLTRQQGRRYRRSDAEYDHTVPLAKGGSRADRFLCAHCNRSLGATLGNRSRLRRRRRLVALNTSRKW